MSTLPSGYPNFIEFVDAGAAGNPGEVVRQLPHAAVPRPSHR